LPAVRFEFLSERAGEHAAEVLEVNGGGLPFVSAQRVNGVRAGGERGLPLEFAKRNFRWRRVVALKQTPLIHYLGCYQSLGEFEPDIFRVEFSYLGAAHFGADGVERIEHRDHSPGCGHERNRDASAGKRVNRLRCDLDRAEK